ncbi:hypothetical protein ABH944_005454 [Caballeronia udeis]|uniref:Uncharacterized protein n=1 Tax=Caballeronia udeis TaxID=1232866 RepID=A0ABW8MPD1_9BURK
MQIIFKGEITIAELRQLLFQTLNEIESDLAVRYSLGATLYVNPTNGFGDAIVPHNKYGLSVNKLYSSGPYRSAADEFKL